MIYFGFVNKIITVDWVLGLKFNHCIWHIFKETANLIVTFNSHALLSGAIQSHQFCTLTGEKITFHNYSPIAIKTQSTDDWKNVSSRKLLLINNIWCRRLDSETLWFGLACQWWICGERMNFLAVHLEIISIICLLQNQLYLLSTKLSPLF